MKNIKEILLPLRVNPSLLMTCLALVFSGSVYGQELKFSSVHTECGHDHSKDPQILSKRTIIKASEIRAARQRQEDFVTQLMKKPKTAEFEFVYSSNLLTDLEFQGAVEFAGEIMGREIVSDIPIQVSIRKSSLRSATASAGNISVSNFPGAKLKDTPYPVSLANTISGTDVNGSTPEISLTFNENVDFYSGLDGNLPASQTDLVTVTLHELCHGLGFLFARDGIFFNQFVDDNGSILADFPRNSSEFEGRLNQASLNVTGQPKLEGVGGADRSLGNALSHLSNRIEDLENNSLMLGSVNDVIRDIGPIVRETFKNIGYVLSSDLIENDLFVSKPGFDITIEDQTTESPLLSFDVQNLSDRFTFIRLRNRSGLIDFSDRPRFILRAGEKNSVSFSIDTKNITSAFTETSIEFVQRGRVIRNIPIKITNNNFPSESTIDISREEITSELITGAFRVDTFLVTNTGTNPVEVIVQSNTAELLVASETLCISPNESNEVRFTINAENTPAESSVVGELTLLDAQTGDTLKQLPVTFRTLSTDFIQTSVTDLEFELTVNDTTENLIIERSVTIKNTSNNAVDLEIITPLFNVFDLELVQTNDRTVTVPAQDSVTVRFFVDAGTLGNSETEDVISINELVTGVELGSVSVLVNISGVNSTNIDFVGDLENRRLEFFDPILLGEERDLFFFAFNDDGSTLPVIREVVTSNPNLILLDAFLEEPSFYDFLFLYTPTSAGIIDETISLILEDDPENPVVISVSGLVLESGEPFALFTDARRNSPLNTTLNLTTTLVGERSEGTELFIENLGDVDLELENIVSSNADFTVETDVTTVGLGEIATLRFVFEPSSPGLTTGEVTINTNDPSNPEFKLNVQGMGALPSVFETPTTPITATLDTDERTTKVFSIDHLEGIELDYAVSKNVVYEVSTSNTSFQDISVIGEDLSARTRNILPLPLFNPTIDESDFRYREIALPFEVNYFGETFSNIAITPFGFISVIDVIPSIRENDFFSFSRITNEPSFLPTRLPEADANINNMISAGFNESMLGRDVFSLNRSDLNVYVLVKESSVTVQWDNLAYNQDGDAISTQIILHQNGAVDILYNEIDEGLGLNNFVVGVENVTGTQGLQLDLSSAPISTGSALSFRPKGNANFITDITPRVGRLNENNSQNVFTTLDATGLIGGDYTQTLTVTDLNTGNQQFVDFDLTVIGQARIELEEDTLNFVLDSLGVTTQTQGFKISNTGTDVLEIFDLFVFGRSFSFNVELPLEIAPKSDTTIQITFQPISRFSTTERGTLFIRSNDQFGNPFMRATLVGSNPLRQFNRPSFAGSEAKVGDEFGASTLNVFPNPASEYIVLELGEELISTQATVVITNLTGQSVMEEVISANQATLSVNDLPSGSYRVEVKDQNNGSIFTTTFVKY